MALINLKKALSLIFLVIISFVIYWRWFFSSKILSYGDWLYLYSKTMSEYISVPLLWSSVGFGSVAISLSSYFTTLLTGIFGSNFVFYLVERQIYMWPIALICPVASYFLFKKILNSSIGAFVGALVYSYNTYFLVGSTGHLTLIAAFSFSPILIHLFIKTLESKKILFAFVTSLVGTLIISYEMRSFYIVSFILLLYMFYHIFVFEKFDRKLIIRSISLSGLIYLFIIGLNFFWLLGIYKTGMIIDNAIFARGIFGNQYMSISNALTIFHPFWNNIKIQTFVVQNISFYYFLFPLLAILGYLLNKENKYLKFFLILSILGIFLSKQGNIPYKDIYAYLYENLLGFNAFRESSKFFYITALGYSALIGGLVSYLLNKKLVTYKILAYVITIFILFVTFINTKSFINGNMGTLFVERHIPNDYLILEKFLDNQSESFRTYWIPKDSRWGFYTNDKPKVSSADVVTGMWNVFVTNKNKPVFNKYLEILNLDISNKLFDEANIKYVIVPLVDIENDDNFYIDYGGKSNKNIAEMYIATISKVPWLKKIDIGTKDLAIFENENYYEHIFISDSIIETRNVEWKKINSTEYRITVKNVSESFVLNFSESYHPDWRLRIGYFTWYQSLLKNGYFLNSNEHTKNFSQMNSFNIDPAIVCRSFECIKNDDNTYNLNLTIFFRPQAYTNIGGIISLSTLSFVVTFFVIRLLKNLLVKK